MWTTLTVQTRCGTSASHKQVSSSPPHLTSSSPPLVPTASPPPLTTSLPTPAPPHSHIHNICDDAQGNSASSRPHAANSMASTRVAPDPNTPTAVQQQDARKLNVSSRTMAGGLSTPTGS